jgi:diguanylate cyclase (GGDEF)-like protein
MIDDARRWYCQGLSLQIEALDRAIRALHAGEQHASESLRRLASGLRDSGQCFGFSEISEAATVLLGVEDGGLDETAARLLDTLRTVTAVVDTAVVKVLYIGADQMVARTLTAALSDRHREVMVALTAEQAERTLDEHDVGLLLLDLMLPDRDGRDLLSHLRRRPDTAGLPIFVLAKPTSTASRAECFALGADAFFVRPVDVAALAPAVVSALQRFGEIRSEPRRDPVTHFLNRAAFSETFAYHASLSARNRSALSVAVIGLERADNVGGTGATDATARSFAQALSRSLREVDVIARWGGDDYVVLFPGTGPKGAMVALKKALRALADTARNSDGDTPVVASFSAGIVAAVEGARLSDIIAEGDRLLYLARTSSGDRVVSSEDAPAKGSRMIVLAEDDQVTANVIQHRLAREGFQVRHFLTSTELLAHVTELSDAGLFVLDVKLPGMDGFQLLQRLRERPEFSEVPVLMLTSLGSEQDIVRAFQLGANDYMTKPFSSAELKARIHRLVEGVRSVR